MTWVYAQSINSHLLENVPASPLVAKIWGAFGAKEPARWD